MQTRRPLPSRARNPLLALVALSLACLLAPGCGRTLFTQPGHAINGHVTLMIPVTNAIGDTVEIVADSKATGITVRFLDDHGLGDSTRTTNGSFRLRLGSDAYRLVVGPTLATSDTLGPFARAETSPALSLQNRGALALSNSRFAPGSTVLRIQFGVQQAGHIILLARALDGTVISHLADGTFAAGVYALVWNGQTDAATNTPPGTYWITCEGAPGPAPNSALSPADIVPAPAPATADSRGSRAAMIVTAP